MMDACEAGRKSRGLTKHVQNVKTTLFTKTGEIWGQLLEWKKEKLRRRNEVHKQYKKQDIREWFAELRVRLEEVELERVKRVAQQAERLRLASPNCKLGVRELVEVLRHQPLAPFAAESS